MRPFGRLLDQVIYFLFQRNQLLLHFLDQHHQARLRLRRNWGNITFKLLIHYYSFK
jgi:hypothetical protein